MAEAEAEYLKLTTEAKGELDEAMAAALGDHELHMQVATARLYNRPVSAEPIGWMPTETGEGPTAMAVAEFNQTKALLDARYNDAVEAAWGRHDEIRAQAKTRFDSRYQASWDQLQSELANQSQSPAGQSLPSGGSGQQTGVSPVTGPLAPISGLDRLRMAGNP